MVDSICRENQLIKLKNIYDYKCFNILLCLSCAAKMMKATA